MTWARRHPVTLLLGFEYLTLVEYPAVTHHSSNLWQISGIISSALVTSSVVEWFFRVPIASVKLVSRVSPQKRYPQPLAAIFVSLVGALALLGSTLLGAGLYSTQVGLTAASPAASLLSPFVPWRYIGAGFALASWKAGDMSRRALLTLLGATFLIELLAAAKIGEMGALMQFAFTVAVGLVIVGFLRPRWLLIGLVAAVLTWPILYQIRNETRNRAIGAKATFAAASTRLRDDLLVQRIFTVGHVSVHEPGPMSIVRYGLVPRFLDRSRASLSTPEALSSYLGEPSNSADTFTVLGTIWSLNGGWIGVMCYVGAFAAVLAVVLRRLTPIRLALGLLVISNCLWIESTYPDDVAGVLQASLSLVIAVGVGALLRYWTRSRQRRQARWRSTGLL